MTLVCPQVLYHCPGLRDGIKKLYSCSTSREIVKQETLTREEEEEVCLSVCLSVCL